MVVLVVDQLNILATKRLRPFPAYLSVLMITFAPLPVTIGLFAPCVERSPDPGMQSALCPAEKVFPSTTTTLFSPTTIGESGPVVVQFCALAGLTVACEAVAAAFSSDALQPATRASVARAKTNKFFMGIL
ncbi:TPA: hypothetical protein L4W73_005936 [Pseudomonas aeruginosa]|nr:hypothetical protein [Pseudomonas aeruginosa]